MDILGKAQDLFSQHMVTIGMILGVTLVLAVGVWFFISRGSQKSPVLENRARVNEPMVSEPTQEQLEEMAKASQQQPVPETQGESQ